jgi:hypothetical protein
MSDVKIDFFALGKTETQEDKSPSYLLNVDVLDDLKHAIREAKESKSSSAKIEQK